MATPALARKQASVYLREDLHAQVVDLAESEGRTFSQMVERLLLRHPALAEEGGAATPGRTDSEARYQAQDHGEPEVPVAPSSASADSEIAAAGTDGKSSPSPPTSAAAKVERDEPTRELGERAGGEARTRPTGRKPASRSTTTALRSHRKPNRPAIVCPSKEFVDGVCQTCGYREG